MSSRSRAVGPLGTLVNGKGQRAGGHPSTVAVEHQDSSAFLYFTVCFSDGLSCFYFQQMEGQLDFID